MRRTASRTGPELRSGPQWICVAALVCQSEPALAICAPGKPAGTAVPQSGRDYCLIMGVCLVVACCVIVVTLPLQRGMTAPSTVRFE